MKRYRWFATKALFDAAMTREEISTEDICFVLDRLRIYTRSNSFDFSNRPIYQGETESTDTAGTWTVNINGITNIYDGLTIKVRLTTGQASSGYNTLNVNSLGALPVWHGFGVPLTSSTTPLVDYPEVILTYRTVASSSAIEVGGTSYTRGWVMSATDQQITPGTGLKVVGGQLVPDFGTVSSSNTTKPVTGAAVDSALDDVAFIEDTAVTGTIASFDPSADTVWNKAQTLSAAQQAQARTNIGAASSSDVVPIQILTQTEYDNLTTVDSSTIYIITE